MDYFKKENEFIKTLIEKTGSLFSVITVETPSISPEDLITRDNFTTEYLESIWLPVDKKIFHFEGIFKNKSDIYLYLSWDGNNPYRLKIIYEISKLDEVTLFIKQISKLKKDGNN